MLSDRCLSVRPVCYLCNVGVRGQTVGWIKMKLGQKVGLGSLHVVLDGDPAPLSPKRAQPVNMTSQWANFFIEYDP